MSDGALSSATREGTAPGSLTDVVDDYRRMRAELERSVSVLATSVDGRQFLRPAGHVPKQDTSLLVRSTFHLINTRPRSPHLKSSRLVCGRLIDILEQNDER
jgi:hypothetical protein